MKTKIFIILAAVAGLVVLYVFNPVDYKLMPKCFFKMLTGLSCPGCGIQRCIHAMVHGHFWEGIRYNYFLIYAGPYALAFAINEYFLPEGPFKKGMKRVLEHHYALYPFIAMIFIWMVLRNILGI